MRNRTCESRNTTLQTQSCNGIPCQGENLTENKPIRSFVGWLVAKVRTGRSFLRVLACSLPYSLTRSSVRSFECVCVRLLVFALNETVARSLASFQKFVLNIDYTVMAVYRPYSLNTVLATTSLGVLSCFDETTPGADCYSVTSELTLESRMSSLFQVVKLLFHCFLQQIFKPRSLSSSW